MIRMKAERLRGGLSQHQLARRSGIHPAEISRIENRRGHLYPGYAKRLEDALGIPAERLLDEVDLEVVTQRGQADGWCS